MSVRPATKLVRQVPNLQSKAFGRWLDAPLFELDDFVITRRNVGKYTDTPCSQAVSNLHHALRRMRISSLDRLFDVGLDGVLRIKGVGERAAWIAACVLAEHNYDADVWCGLKRRGARTTRGAIRLVHRSTRNQKHE